MLLHHEFVPKYETKYETLKAGPGRSEIVIFYTEILWCFFRSEMCEKIHNSTFRVKFFSNEMEK